MDTTTKYACALIPGLPLQALRRVQPEVGDCPLAIVHGHGSKALIVNASRAALQAGIFLGMSPVQAKSIATAVILRSVSERVIDSARQALIDVAFSFSPNVMPLGGDSVVLDMTGLFSMYPSPPLLLHSSHHHQGRFDGQDWDCQRSQTGQSRGQSWTWVIRSKRPPPLQPACQCLGTSESCFRP